MYKIDIKIDIAMTATMRMELFKKTIDSFFLYMFDDYRDAGHELNLILNIDPVGFGESLGQIESYIDKIRNKFDRVVIRHPAAASFPKAFKYVWSKVRFDSDYVFHLEDDWELTQKIDLRNLFRVLEAEDDLALIRLAAFFAGPNSMKNWNKFFPYNGDYYECPEEMKAGLGFCGHPSLIKAEFVRNTARFLDENRNPEKQFHSRGHTKIMQEVMKWRYGVYSMPGYPPLILDIGRQWMIKNGFRKAGSKAHFTNWERADGQGFELTDKGRIVLDKLKRSQGGGLNESRSKYSGNG